MLQVRPTRLAALSLLGTLALGLSLRWALAGAALPWGQFGPLRSAHTHLGYYGVLFPLIWAAWARVGAPAPGPRLVAAYGLAVGVATWGFAREGYALTSIVASTAVLAAWVWTATPLWARLLRRDWLAAAAPCVWASALAIPGVAVLSARGDARAPELVQAFLTWLLLGVAAPAALASLRAPAPPGPALTLAALGAGLAIGPAPHPLSQLALALLGGIFLLAARRLEPLLAVAWAGLGGALFLMGAGLLVETHGLAVAGLHYAVLGPVLLSLAWPAAWRGARPVVFGLLLVFCGAIALPGWVPGGGGMRLAALSGSALAAAWAGVGLRALWGHARSDARNHTAPPLTPQEAP